MKLLRVVGVASLVFVVFWAGAALAQAVSPLAPDLSTPAGFIAWAIATLTMHAHTYRQTLRLERAQKEAALGYVQSHERSLHPDAPREKTL